MAPLTIAKADASDVWFKHLCFPNMGCHYFQLNYDEKQGKLKRGMSDDDVTVMPWLPFNKKLVTFLF